MYTAKTKGRIQFSLRPPVGAQRVLVAGDFNDWAPIPLKRSKTGTLALEVKASQEIYQYKFVVDGQWVLDPDNPLKAISPLGTVNSVARVAQNTGY